MPDDVLAVPAAHAGAAGRFAAIPTSHKADYPGWIEDARKPDTRSRRITGMIGKPS